jgi:hypothetical protein
MAESRIFRWRRNRDGERKIDRVYFGDDALVAAAEMVIDSEGNVLRRPPQSEWQKDAFGAYRQVGPLRYAARFVGNAASRARLGVYTVPDDPEEMPQPAGLPVIDDEGHEQIDPQGVQAAAYMQGIRTPKGPLSSLVRDLAIHIFVAGETYLLFYEDGKTWDVVSVSELDWSDKSRTGNVTVKRREKPGSPGKELPEGSVLQRIWSTDPEWPDMPDSAFQSILDDATQYLLYNQVERGVSLSRLAQAGMLLFPSEAFPTSATDDSDEDPRDVAMNMMMEHMTAAIKDPDSAAAAVPNFMFMGADYIDKVKHLTFDRQADEHIKERRDALVNGMAMSLELPAEVLLGVGDLNHWCRVMDEAWVYGRAGWLHSTQVEVGTEILTLNHETGLSEWQPVLDMYAAEVTDEPMLHLRGQAFRSTTTAEHRWPIWKRHGRDGRWEREWVTSKEMDLDPRTRIIKAVPSAEIPDEAKYTDAFVEAVAWITTEGSVGLRPGRLAPQVKIWQSQAANPHHVASIKRTLTALFGAESDLGGGGRAGPGRGKVDGTPRWKFHQRPEGQTGTDHFSLNTVASAVFAEAFDEGTRRVRPEFIQQLTASQLALFIDTFVKGDGHANGTTRYLFQKDRTMLDAPELAAMLLGYATNTYTQDGTHKFGGEVWCLSVYDKPYFTPQRTGEWKPYTGTVWSPTVANGTILARDGEDGAPYYTGQSAWLVDENTYKIHLEPLLSTIAGALTTGWLRPVLMLPVRDGGMNLSEEEASRYQVWFDPKPMVARPQKFTDVKAAHEVFAASNEALRRAANLTEADAPDEDEIKERLAITQAQQTRTIVSDDAEDPNVDDRSTPDEQDQPGDSDQPEGNEPPDEGGMTAAAVPFRGVLAKSLTLIDRILFTRLLDAAEVEMERAMEKAGARIRTATRNEPSITAAIDRVPNADVVATLGPSIVGSLPLPTAKLLTGAFGPALQKRMEQMVKEAQEETQAWLRRVTANDSLVNRVWPEGAVEEDRSAGVAGLVAALYALASRNLESADEEAEVAAIAAGEAAARRVPPGLVRHGLTRLGGWLGGSDRSQGVGGYGPIGGPATGFRMTDQVLPDCGIAIEQFVWNYGAPGARTTNFEPHLVLDQLTFDSWASPFLIPPASATWLGVDFMFPGDHAGCLCDFDLVLVCSESGEIIADSSLVASPDIAAATAEKRALLGDGAGSLACGNPNQPESVEDDFSVEDKQSIARQAPETQEALRGAFALTNAQLKETGLHAKFAKTFKRLTNVKLVKTAATSQVTKWGHFRWGIEGVKVPRGRMPNIETMVKAAREGKKLTYEIQLNTSRTNPAYAAWVKENNAHFRATVTAAERAHGMGSPEWQAAQVERDKWAAANPRPVKVIPATAQEMHGTLIHEMAHAESFLKQLDDEMILGDQSNSLAARWRATGQDAWRTGVKSPWSPAFRYGITNAEEGIAEAVKMYHNGIEKVNISGAVRTVEIEKLQPMTAQAWRTTFPEIATWVEENIING